MTRKPPVRHTVKSYIRKGQSVRSYARGNGTKPIHAKLSQRYLRPKIVTEFVDTIGRFQDYPENKYYTLVTDTQDVEAIWDEFGNDPTVTDFGGFLVKVGEGEYKDVLGFQGNVPWDYKSLYRIVRK